MPNHLAAASAVGVTLIATYLFVSSRKRRPTGAAAAAPAPKPKPSEAAAPAAAPAAPLEAAVEQTHSSVVAAAMAATRPTNTRKKSAQNGESGDAAAKRGKAALATPSQPAARAGASAAAAAAEPDAPSAGEPFVNAIVSRAILTQPVDLLAAANPPSAKADAKPKPGDKKKKKEKPISSWAEGFMAAMTTLEGTAVDAALKSQQQLTGCIASASKPGAPREALAITLRGLGFVFASMGQLPKAEAAYSRARTEAQKKSGASAATLGCWRDLAVLAREQINHVEAERCWREAAETLLAMQAAEAKVRPAEQRRGGGGTAAAGEQAAAAARLELQLCRGDCLRDQGRLAECAETMSTALSWREKQLGKEHPLTLGAVYDVSRVARAAQYAAALAASAPAEPAEATAAAAAPSAADAEAAAAAEAATAAVAAAAGAMGAFAAAQQQQQQKEAAAAAEAALGSSRVAAALEAMGGAAVEMDERWLQGLKGLCTGEAEHKWAEHVNMLASVAQLHKDYAEASFLFRLAHPTLRSLHGSEGLDYAELLNSEGECLVELGCYDAAAPAFDAAHDAVVATNGDDDPSVASIEANQANVLSNTGQHTRADELFARAMRLMGESVAKLDGQPLQPAQPEDTSLFMVQVMHARVLKLFADHEERVGGRAEHAAALYAEAKRLEETYGFLS